MNSPPAATGSQETGLTQPKAHLLADPCRVIWGSHFLWKFPVARNEGNLTRCGNLGGDRSPHGKKRPSSSRVRVRRPSSTNEISPHCPRRVNAFEVSNFRLFPSNSSSSAPLCHRRFRQETDNRRKIKSVERIFNILDSSIASLAAYEYIADSNRSGHWYEVTFVFVIQQSIGCRSWIIHRSQRKESPAQFATCNGFFGFLKFNLPSEEIRVFRPLIIYSLTKTPWGLNWVAWLD